MAGNRLMPAISLPGLLAPSALAALPAAATAPAPDPVRCEALPSFPAPLRV